MQVDCKFHYHAAIASVMSSTAPRLECLPSGFDTSRLCCSSTSTAPKDDRGEAAGGSGRQSADPFASGSSSLTDLPGEEECSGTSRRLTADSEEDAFSFNEDETESQEVNALRVSISDRAMLA